MDHNDIRNQVREVEKLYYQYSEAFHQWASDSGNMTFVNNLKIVGNKLYSAKTQLANMLYEAKLDGVQLENGVIYYGLTNTTVRRTETQKIVKMKEAK